jgi:hypothetical protein
VHLLIFRNRSMWDSDRQLLGITRTTILLVSG